MRTMGGVAVGAIAIALAGGARAEPDLADRFGARESVHDISIAPDGRHVVYLTPGRGRATVVAVIDLAADKTDSLNVGDDRLSPVSCGWASNVRLVCRFFGVGDYLGLRVPYTRTLGFDANGANPVYLGRRSGDGAEKINQVDAQVIDWRGGDGGVVMARTFVPDTGTIGSHIGGDRTLDGLGIELVDTVTGKAQLLERPSPLTSTYLADGQGNIRMKADDLRNNGVLTGTTVYSYRLAGERDWRPFSRDTLNTRDALVPLGVDGSRNVAYASKMTDGRQAVYRVALDGTMKMDLVSSSLEVDVDSVVRIGRRGRIIGATYVTDRRQVDYFDPEYKKLAAALGRALPKTPLITFVGATADEGQLLVHASSDTQPGTYFLFSEATRHLDHLLSSRSELSDVAMGVMKAVRFKAGDGTMIPAYLTLPPGSDGKNLPAIVMPHGGPDYRDEWGFDWLVQFYATAGYAVLQPQFRGSAGYGDAWFAGNAFHSWQLAIGDVADAGRWLVKEGIADPKKLAIVGWSYGGYAALQVNVVDPDLYRAVVAIAPVTDLGRTKREADGFTNRALVERQIGKGENVVLGSPARHADRFKAPVLMFHGDDDLNVGVGQSRLMDKRLREAGKASTLVVYPKVDHALDDGAARAGLLRQSDAFMKAAFAR